MNLLPKCHQEFSDAEYWDAFFRKRGKKAFEWYGNYAELCGVLHKYIRTHDHILEIGCGNSNLAAELYDAGYRDITSIDISAVVVRQMQQRRPDVRYVQMDALHMSFDDDSFSVVLDKGTLDALMPAGSGAEQTERLCKEVARVTRPGGRFVCVSLLQEHIIRHLLQHFAGEWLVRVVRCADFSGRMPVFAVVCTKLVQPLPQPILELSLTEAHVQRVANADEACRAVHSVQQVAMVCAGLHEHALGSHADLSFDLEDATTGHTRYTVHVLEAPPSHRPYAAFIVPQGREVEWLFGTAAGRRDLARNAHTRRLAVVTMHRGQQYASLDCVKDEVADAIKNFAPALPPAYKIPFLSVGEEVGTRETRHQAVSAASGEFVVEDCTSEGALVRRLIFLSSQNVVQSEARLRRCGNRVEVDPLHLSCQHHVAISVGCVAARTGTRILVIGLGGGGLCTFLSRCLLQADLTAVDLDEAMRDVAVRWFGLQPGPRLRVHIADGLEYLQAAAARRDIFDAIVLDVDSKDGGVGMSCPPRNFLEADALETVRSCLPEAGLLLVNLVARDPALREWALHQLHEAFEPVATYRVPDELNEVAFCARGGGAPADLLARLGDAARELEQTVRKVATNKRNKRKQIAHHTPLLDVEQFKRAIIVHQIN